MSIYLISNRKVFKEKNTNGEEIERFNNKGKERARREFRVASCNINEKTKKVEYSIIKDKDIPDYSDVVSVHKGTDKLNQSDLPGTSYMFYDLYNQMLNDKEKQSDTLFFIHGFANTLESNLEQIVKIHDIYLKPENGIKHLVYVSWPSIGHKVYTYWNDQEDAEETGRILGALFTKLHSFFFEIFNIQGFERCSNKIHLMAHSMGNSVLEFMIKSISNYKMFPLFGETLLLHADCPNDVFEPEGSLYNLKNITKRCHIYISRSDNVLGTISESKNEKPRLGHKGPVDRTNLNSETFIMDTTNSGYGDTPRERTLDHWGYIERQNVIKDIIYVLSGMDEDDIPTRKKWKEEKQYFYLKNS